MIQTRYFLVIISLLIVAGCGGPKVLTDYKTTAEEALANGNYENAVAAWESYFAQQIDAEAQIQGAEFAKAAKVAYDAEMYDKAAEWFDNAETREYADAEMYEEMADIYQSIDNLSKELRALEFYTENFGQENSSVNQRLFEIYYEIDRYDDALAVWERMPEEALETEALLEKYFLIHEDRENDDLADSASEALLELNPEHIQALEWNAMKYYWQAENRYRREMEKYEQNKTTRQYNQLVEQLKTVTADFKRSLNYLETLWELNPGEKYAPYLANIYTRFNDAETSAYYRKFLEE